MGPRRGRAGTRRVQRRTRLLQVGELGLDIWERVLVRPLSAALTARIVSALHAARDAPPDPRHADIIRQAIQSTVHVCTPPPHQHPNSTPPRYSRVQCT